MFQSFKPSNPISFTESRSLEIWERLGSEDDSIGVYATNLNGRAFIEAEPNVGSVELRTAEETEDRTRSNTSEFLTNPCIRAVAKTNRPNQFHRETGKHTVPSRAQHWERSRSELHEDLKQ